MDDRTAARMTALAFAVVVLIGGTNFVAARISNRELPPFWGAALRLTAASLVLFAVVAVQRLPLPRGPALTGAALYGLFGFGVAYGFAYWGLRHVPAGLAAIIMAATPLFTFGLAQLHRQEALRWRPLGGGVVALAGIGMMSGGSVGAAVPLASLLAIVATSLAAAESSILVKQFPRSHPVTTNAVGMLIGGLVLAVTSAAAREPRVIPAQAGTWIALLYLIVLGSSAGFVLFLFVLKQWPASAVANQFVLFPLVAVSLSTWLDRAPVNSALALGGLLVLAGVYIGAASRTPFVRTPHRLGSEPCLTCAE